MMRFFGSNTLRRDFLLILLPVLFFSSVAWGAQSDGWTRVDSVIATINGDPVLESDILMEIDFGLLESAHLGSDFNNLLDAYLNRMLILREVEEVGGFRLTTGQVEGAYRGYLSRYKNIEDYRAKLQMWGIDEEDVLTMLRQALLVSLYTESRIQFFVNVLPSDIEKTYEEDRERWGDRTLYEAWETIRSELLQSNYRREKERWLNTLRERYDLTIFRPNGVEEK